MSDEQDIYIYKKDLGLILVGICFLICGIATILISLTSTVLDNTFRLILLVSGLFLSISAVSIIHNFPQRKI